MKSSTTNVETPINEEVFHEVSESFQGESSSSSLNDDVQQSPEEVILPQTNTQSIPINMVPNGDEASTSHMCNKDLQDKYDVLKNQTTTFEMNNNELNEQLKEFIEKNNDLLAQTKVLKDQLQVK
nr:hypothetical protein [Tanacetum cinerariifolium]